MQATATARLIARIEAATERERRRTEQDLERQNEILARSDSKWLTIDRDQAAHRVTYFSQREATCRQRANIYQEKYWIFGKALTWFNRTLATYYNWRSRLAARKRDDCAADLAKLENQ